VRSFFSGFLIVDRHQVRGGESVPGTKTTSGEHLVPVTSDTLMMIRTHLDQFGPGHDGPVFSNTVGSPVNQDDFSSRITPTIRKVAGERWRPHLLRSAAQTDFRRVSDRGVADALLNHKPGANDIAGAHYDTVTWAEKVEAVEARGVMVAEFLFAQPEVEVAA
jgi:integrase